MARYNGGRRGADRLTHAHAVLRTPLMAATAFTRWSDRARATAAQVRTWAADGEVAASDQLIAAVTDDIARLRADLAEALRQPAVAEALFLASPSLSEQIEQWFARPDSARGRRIERTVIRYWARMTGRATPFGLLAGIGPAHIAERTELSLPPHSAYRRHTRLDNDYLLGLCTALSEHPLVRCHLRYRVNSTVYQLADQLRYVEVAAHPGNKRSYHLVSADALPAITAVLDRVGTMPDPARGRDNSGDGDRTSGLTRSMTRAAIAASVCAEHPGLAADEAEQFVDELIASQLLVPDFGPPVTRDPAGDGPTRGMAGAVDRLLAGAGPAGQPLRAPLAAARRALRDLDQRPIGAGAEPYRALAHTLAELPAPVDPARLVQVDMVVPGRASIARPVIAEIARAVSVLARIAARPSRPLLSRFVRDFRARYGDRR
ncbi:MAG: lantibiotic dehydratase, partial [Myxococcota bacterium]